MKKLLGILIILIVIGCQTESTSSSAVNMNIAGTYILTSLTANTPVDFNQDGVSHTELLNEAACFASMDIDFLVNGDFFATVAEPNFDLNNNFTCLISSQNGTYSLSANSVLTIVAQVNGGSITHNKAVTFTPTTFEVSLTGQELDQYVGGRTGTPASSITSLDAVYTKI
ncbi:lipocalin family protein [Nonlabens sp.]|uniref:lipocalin family protein n=1 Tax=Nonlabens sp. TaxID=1888209 RepID=UPI0025E73E42|nr:lipocalin family protein [Nonlabens sp.]